MSLTDEEERELAKAISSLEEEFAKLKDWIEKSGVLAPKETPRKI
jgi:hypothetical protein